MGLSIHLSPHHLFSFPPLRRSSPQFATMKIAKAAEVLGVGTDVEAAELKATYRRLALQHHPDKCADGEREEATSKFQEISRAYQCMLSFVESGDDGDSEEELDAAAAEEHFRDFLSRMSCKFAMMILIDEMNQLNDLHEQGLCVDGGGRKVYRSSRHSARPFEIVMTPDGPDIQKSFAKKNCRGGADDQEENEDPEMVAARKAAAANKAATAEAALLELNAEDVRKPRRSGGGGKKQGRGGATAAADGRGGRGGSAHGHDGGGRRAERTTDDPSIETPPPPPGGGSGKKKKSAGKKRGKGGGRSEAGALPTTPEAHKLLDEITAPADPGSPTSIADDVAAQECAIN